MADDIVRETVNRVARCTMSICGEKSIADFLHQIGRHCTVSNGKPVFNCNGIAEYLSLLTGVPVEPNWVLHGFK